MGRVKAALRRLTKSPGVPQARHIAERSVAPYLRADVHQLTLDHAEVEHRLTALQLRVDLLNATIDAHMPAVLNAIASTTGTARIMTRRTQEIEKAMWDGDEAIRLEVRPHIETLAWLLQRVETIRVEMMHELRYGQSPRSDHSLPAVEPKIINDAHLSDDDVRLNLGAGHIAIDGFVNVDMRELPGIDVVAPIDGLPFEPGTIAEIFSSHTVEHFPEQELRRRLLPYWVRLLRPGGTFRAIVPDLEAMTKAYAKDELSFEVLRAVTYGGQEYEGDFHFTGFTPESLSSLLVGSGLEQPKVIARGRPNGDCLEFEVSATKPRS